MLLIQINGAISVGFKFYPSTGKRHTTQEKSFARQVDLLFFILVYLSLWS